jgi:hypothetical protein
MSVHNAAPKVRNLAEEFHHRITRRAFDGSVTSEVVPRAGQACPPGASFERAVNVSGARIDERSKGGANYRDAVVGQEPEGQGCEWRKDFSIRDVLIDLKDKDRVRVEFRRGFAEKHICRHLPIVRHHQGAQWCDPREIGQLFQGIELSCGVEVAELLPRLIALGRDRNSGGEAHRRLRVESTRYERVGERFYTVGTSGHGLRGIHIGLATGERENKGNAKQWCELHAKKLA